MNMEKFLRKIFKFTGRAGRKEFWITLLSLLSVYFIFIPMVALISFFSLSLDIKLISTVLLLFTSTLGGLIHICLLVAGIALFVRRLRDSKISKMALIGSMLASPVISLSILVVLPKEVTETMRNVGRANLLMASSLLVFYIFGLPLLAVGLFPSKK
jgi:uncharacterized membrane protein YhaH (DUF805 family)